MINEKSSAAKPALIFVILLVIIIALGAIVYLTMFKKSSPATVQPTATPTENLITNVDISDWNIYKNEKFGYEIKYPQTINCEQELGIGIDPADNYICSLKKQNNLFISIKPQIIESSQDRISFYRSAKMGSIDAVDIQNKDILATISNYMESIDFIALNKSNFVALNDTNNLIGFSKTESYNSNTLTPAIWYDESWFFIHDNVLFAVYISYDGLQQNSNAELSQISDLKSIITTLTFYKPSGINADPQYNTNIADWKTYKNEKIGFEFKYPKDYWEQIVTSENNQIDLRLNTDLVSVEVMGTKNSNNKNYDFSSIEDFKKWHDLYVLNFGEDVIKDVEKTTINQFSVLKTHEVDGIGNSIGEYIYFQNGESIVYFVNDYDDNVSATMIFNQIIFSFKFIK